MVLPHACPPSHPQVGIVVLQRIEVKLAAILSRSEKLEETWLILRPGRQTKGWVVCFEWQAEASRLSVAVRWLLVVMNYFGICMWREGERRSLGALDEKGEAVGDMAWLWEFCQFTVRRRVEGKRNWLGENGLRVCVCVSSANCIQSRFWFTVGWPSLFPK